MKNLEKFNFFKKPKRFDPDEVTNWYKPIIEDLSEYLLETFDKFNIPENSGGQYWDSSYWKICFDHHIEVKSPSHIDVLMDLQGIQSHIESRLGRPILIVESDGAFSHPNICIYLRQPGTKDKILDARTIMEINEWNLFNNALGGKKKEDKLYKFISVYDRMKYKRNREDYTKYELDKISAAFKNTLAIWPSKLDVFQSNIKLNYLEYDIDIDKYEDEYYIICFDSVDGRSSYLCDSLDGLLQAIKDNK